MMKSEFDSRILTPVTPEEYEIIETVYTYYPDNEKLDKDLAATLYNTFGMRVFEDLYPRAKRVKDLDEQIHKLKLERNQL